MMASVGEPGLTDLEVLLCEELRTWPAPASAAAVLRGHDDVVSCGPDQAYAWASVTKLLTALVVLDGVWQGTLSLDDPAGPPGSTVRHLLAHASGLSVDTDRVLSPPGTCCSCYVLTSRSTAPRYGDTGRCTVRAPYVRMVCMVTCLFSVI